MFTDETQMRPGMIQFARMDLGKRMGDVGPVSSDGGRMYYPSIYLPSQEKPIDLPDEGTARIKFRVCNRETVTRDGKTTHSATLDVMSIETEDEPKKLPGSAKRIRPGQIRFDDRPRNNNGQFVADQTGGVDPNSMAAAYGGVAAEKQRRLSILRRLMAFRPTSPQV